MTSPPNLDQLLSSLENLPTELHRNFTLMHELDSRAQNMMQNIDKMVDKMFNGNKQISDNDNSITISNIQRHFDSVKAYSDDKVQLSIQTYELVDARIKKLDSCIAQLNAKIGNAAIKATRNSELKIGGSKMMTRAEPSKIHPIAASTDPMNSTSSVANVSVGSSSLTDTLVEAEDSNLSEEDMPIDPNEPTFCLCKRVSYGQMIACDNTDCPIEWFHFDCMKLIAKPKGKWFCPKCGPEEKTKKKHK